MNVRASVLIGLWCLGYLVLGIATLKDYGPGFDFSEFFIGDRSFYLLKDADPAHLNLHERSIPLYHDEDHPDLYKYSFIQRYRPLHVWPIGPIASSFSKHIFFTKLRLLDPIDAHHLIGPLLSTALLAILIVFLRTRLGPWGIAATVLFISLHPRFFSHMHYNIKDIPSTFAYWLAIIAFVVAVEKGRALWLLGAAFVFGVALATKANAFFLPFVLGPYLLLQGLKLDWRTILIYTAFPIIAVAVMCLLWPFMLSGFPESLSGYFQHLFSRGIKTDTGWSALPLMLALTTTPPAFLLVLLVGISSLVVSCLAKRNERAFSCLIVLSVIVPVLRVSIPGAHDFDGIRHWLEFVPAAGIAIGFGFDVLAKRVKSVVVLSVILMACTLPTICWNYKNHPHQATYFNILMGGAGNAQAAETPQATDYWGISYRQAIRWLNENAESNSFLLVGVARNSVLMTSKIWLRRDIIMPQPPVNLDHRVNVKSLKSFISNLTSTVYYMYVTRTEHYDPYTRELDQTIKPIYTIEVDGGVILKILKIKSSQP